MRADRRDSRRDISPAATARWDGRSRAKRRRDYFAGAEPVDVVVLVWCFLWDDFLCFFVDVFFAVLEWDDPCFVVVVVVSVPLCWAAPANDAINRKAASVATVLLNISYHLLA